MKLRPFLAALLALVLVLVGLGLSGWWLVWKNSPLQLAHRPLVVPTAARFVPRQAALSLHLFSDGEEPVRYARAVAPSGQRREAVDAIERLRDGSFAAFGLDYRSELAGWLAPDITLALLDQGGVEGQPGWLLALTSRDEEGARRFLQRFWQTRSLAGADLQVSSYRGMGLISGRGALVGEDPVPLATALVRDDLVLIASGRGVLEQALDVSQIDELNQAAQPAFAAQLAELGEGAALLQARPAAMRRWLDLPLPESPGSDPTLLTAVLEPEGRSLRVKARLDLPAPLPAARASGPDQRQALLEGLVGEARSLALLEDPALWLEQPLLAAWVQPLLGSQPGSGPLPGLVAAAARGSLLVAEGPQGWLLGSGSDQPDPADLEAPLAAEGLIPAPLELDDRSLLVWTQLQAGRGSRRTEGRDQLEASLAGWRSLQAGQAWWGQSLAQLQARGGRSGQQRQHQLQELGQPQAPLQWALAEGPARALLQAWQPWRLLSTLAGGGLAEPVQGLTLAMEPEGATLRLQGRLELS